MISFRFVAGTGEKRRFAVSSVLSPEFGVFAQMQERGDLSKPPVHQCPLPGYLNKSFFSFKLFQEKLACLSVPGPSVIVVSTVHRGVFITMRLQISLLLTSKEKTLTRKVFWTASSYFWADSSKAEPTQWDYVLRKSSSPLMPYWVES